MSKISGITGKFCIKIIGGVAEKSLRGCSGKARAPRELNPQRGIEALRPVPVHHRPVLLLPRLVVHPPKADVTDVLERLRGAVRQVVISPRWKNTHLPDDELRP